ncbi:MAG: hypothetical protein CL694_05845 [Chloroflexi bacterium]|nr:hypothetical protein [Chloroflexota bacterium]
MDSSSRPPNRKRPIGLGLRHTFEAYVTVFGGDAENWDCATVVSDSVSGAIADLALANDVDLIAMYTHDRHGLSALIGRSIAKDVVKRAGADVKVFKPQELSRAS